MIMPQITLSHFWRKAKLHHLALEHTLRTADGRNSTKEPFRAWVQESRRGRRRRKKVCSIKGCVATAGGSGYNRTQFHMLWADFAENQTRFTTLIRFVLTNLTLLYAFRNVLKLFMVRHIAGSGSVQLWACWLQACLLSHSLLLTWILSVSK